MIVLGVSDNYPLGLLLGFLHSGSVFAVGEGSVWSLSGACFFSWLSGISFLTMMRCADCSWWLKTVLLSLLGAGG